MADSCREGPVSRVSRVSVVLPCAGQGRRFQAPYPKELHCLAPGMTVLDRALAPVVDLAATGTPTRVVAVVSPQRAATVAYLGRYADTVELVVVVQSPRRPAAVAAALDAALPACAGPVALVLPDQFFDLPAGRNPLRAALDRLADGRWAVLASWASGAAMREEGALRLVADSGGHRVADAAEKPSDPGGFNAVWVSVVCSAAAAPDLWRLFDPGAPSPLLDAPAVLVEGYRHLTTPGAP